MRQKIQFTTLLLLLLASFRTLAQESFSEGSIVYNVTMQATPGNVAKQIGTYTITIKNKMVRKEFVLDNGFSNTLIFNIAAGTAVSLKNIPDRKYAIQLNMADLKEQYKQYEGFKLNESAQTSASAGYNCNQATATYRNGKSVNVCLSKWSLTDPMIFEYFPSIKYLPLSFEFINEEGKVIVFDAKEVLRTPVESSLFRIPTDYKIITNEEYKKMSQ
ncbi:hypothetical protein [Taibaiella soli]|uniref:DUF4412 domain-containing protein n=1 Tax=Taibaiella soli TaxID=1649169 RepID=A0A2W2AIU9_9BACT|nr:hypothetical protein [Taibaiella soli]PZF72160.1 hypothetical protein DN068_14590 [Taibaiella soli]